MGVYPFIFSDAARAAAVTEVGAIAGLVERPLDRVLDLCCGPGRHSVPLAKQGSHVTGADRSPLLLQRAREYAAREHADVRWIEGDVRQFAEPRAYDVALNLFTSFGYFEAAGDNRQVLANAYVSLVPGGVFVLDLIGKEVLARIYQPLRVQELSDGTILVQRARVTDNWSRGENDWTIISGGESRRFRFRHWLYSAAELRELLKSVGFTRVALFGSFDRAPYDAEAQRLVARAEKR